MCSYSEAVYGAGFREGFREGFRKAYRESFRKAYRESFRKGLRKGKIEVIADLVRDNIITLAVAAERAGVSEEGFLAEAGIHDMD